MTLTEDEVRNAVQTWLTKHSSHTMQCPLCRKVDWATGRLCSSPTMVPPGGTFLSIPMTCRACAYTLFLDASLVAGIHPPKP
jgi:C4-type Zn-finger protein